MTDNDPTLAHLKAEFRHYREACDSISAAIASYTTDVPGQLHDDASMLYSNLNVVANRLAEYVAYS